MAVYEYDLEKFLGSGWHSIEKQGEAAWVWSKKEAFLHFPTNHQGFKVFFSGSPALSFAVTIYHNNNKIHTSKLTQEIIAYNIPPHVTSCGIRLSDSWIPNKLLQSDDRRQLGVCLHGISSSNLYSEGCDWYPKVIEMGLSGICNINPPCVMCTARNFRQSAEQPFLSEKIVNKMLPYLNYAEIISLHGGEGEPLLSPVLFDILDRIDTEKVYTLFATNGLLLTKATSLKLIKAGLRELSVSIDAASRLTYHKIRNNDGFETIKNNVRRLADLKRDLQAHFPTIVINMVLMKENLPELPSYVDLARELEASVVRIRCLVPIPKNYEIASDIFHFNYYEQRVDPFSRECKDIIAEAKRKAQQYRILLVAENPEIAAMLYEEETPATTKTIDTKTIDMTINLSGGAVDDNFSLSQQNIKCRLPWENLIIDTDGRVRFCCHSKQALGNLEEIDFSEIWNGEPAQSIRRDFLRNIFPESCSACPLRHTQNQAWSGFINECDPLNNI